jgi:hypothetical protein
VGSGCVVNLIGSGAKLSRATRKEVCLGRISVFLRGESPEIVNSGDDYPYLVNRWGTYFLNDTAFLDRIDLGPDGVSVTGVGFSRVQESNLCGNPDASAVIAVTFGVFGVLFILTTLAAHIWARRQPTPARSRGIDTLMFAGSVVGVGLTIYGLLTQILVLVDVWGLWPMWVVLASLVGPSLITGHFLAQEWSSMPSIPCGKVRFEWIWPPYELYDDNDQPALESRADLKAWKHALLFLLSPVLVLPVLLYDVAAALDSLNMHPVLDGTTYTLQSYREAHALVNVFLRSIPQAVFQSIIYVLGSSRATRIYVDEYLFLSAIAAALFLILKEYFVALVKAIKEKESLWVNIKKRLGYKGAFAIPKSADRLASTKW